MSMITTPTTEQPKRQRRTLTEARDLVVAWRGSGMNKEAWCRERGLLRSTLSSCLYRIEQADTTAASPATFIAIRPPRYPRAETIDLPSPSSTVAIELPSGLRIIGLDVAGAAAVVRLLQEAGP